MSIRSAASCAQPLHEIAAPRGALTGSAGRPLGALIYTAMML